MHLGKFCWKHAANCQPCYVRRHLTCTGADSYVRSEILHLCCRMIRRSCRTNIAAWSDTDVRVTRRLLASECKQTYTDLKRALYMNMCVRVLACVFAPIRSLAVMRYARNLYISHFAKARHRTYWPSLKHALSSASHTFGMMKLSRARLISEPIFVLSLYEQASKQASKSWVVQTDACIATSCEWLIYVANLRIGDATIMHPCLFCSDGHGRRDSIARTGLGAVLVGWIKMRVPFVDHRAGLHCDSMNWGLEIQI